MTLPALFRHKLTINGAEFEDFFDVSIVNKCSGNGMSGTVSMQLNFKIKETDYFSASIPKKAVVKFDMDGTVFNLPDFFINRRSKSGNTIAFSCLDRMALTDKPINIDNINFDENENVSYIMVIQCICSTCGFSDWSYIGDEGTLLSSLPDVKKSDIYDKSCRTILDEFSKACCGIWVTDGRNILKFVPYGTAINEGTCVTVNHAKVEMGLLPPAYDGVIMMNGDKTYISGDVSEDSNVYTINSAYASQDMANGLKEFLCNVTYQPWSCSKVEIDAAVFMNSNVRFSDGVVRFCNGLTIYPRAYGIYASLGCNSVEDNELAYNGEITRALNNCIKADEELNGCMVTRYQGIVFTAEEQPKTKASGETVKKKYGFATSAGGITEYDGAMVSKVVPKSATWNDDKTEATVSYEGKQYVYKITRDDNGNITGFTKEEITA